MYVLNSVLHLQIGQCLGGRLSPSFAVQSESRPLDKIQIQGEDDVFLDCIFRYCNSVVMYIFQNQIESYQKKLWSVTFLFFVLYYLIFEPCVVLIFRSFLGQKLS